MSDMIGRIFNWAETVNDTDLDTAIAGLLSRREARIKARIEHYKAPNADEHALVYLGRIVDAIRAYKWRTGVSVFEAKEVITYHRNKAATKEQRHD